MCKTKSVIGGTNIKLLIKSQPILNIKTNDTFCVLWSILAFFHPRKTHHDTAASYMHHSNELDLDGIDFINNLGDEVKLNLESKSIFKIIVFKISKMCPKDLMTLDYYQRNIQNQKGVFMLV